MKLRVWWTRNGKQTRFSVKDVEEAKKVINRESSKDLKDRFVTWNAGGLEVYEDGEWSEWYSEEGLDIMEVIDGEGEGKSL